MRVSFIFFSLVVLCFACTDPTEQAITVKTSDASEPIEVPSLTVEQSKLQYDRKTSVWTLEDQLFSGYAVSYYPDSTLMNKISILDGKKQNETIEWFADGHIKRSSNYNKGKLDGSKKAWVPDTDSTYLLLSDLNYSAGRAHGTQKKWYITGEIFTIRNMDMGKETGMQQAFRKNGDLYVNYEARDGRIFGLRKSNLCFGLKDEIIQK